MEVRELSVPGAFEVTPVQHRDDRGVFLESFRQDLFTEVVGHPLRLEQSSCSVSEVGTLRGIHFAELPPSQAKFVTCVHGAGFDVVVDLRIGSPAFGRWEGVVLDDQDRKAVYLPEGLGHGFMALEPGTVISYLCSAAYSPAREHGIHALDPELGIEWPTQASDGSAILPRMSPRDAQAPTLAEVRERGWLASYDDAVAFARSLA